MTRTLLSYGAACLLVFATACSTTTSTTQQAAIPIAAPAETVFVAQQDAVAPLEPGRFDMGKMWTFENAPLAYFQEAYDFTATDEWLEHVRMASLRLPNCTASFVSSGGLVMSNHHCARGSASQVTREGEDLLTNGFYAETLEDERPVPGLWVDQLVKMQDVTPLVMGNVNQYLSDAALLQQRQDVQRAIGDSASAAYGLQCSVTSLYQGGKYSLYCFKRYDDVRLVFVPELQIGYFGGDADNFTYPRYVVDASFFRVYENGQPYHPEKFFGWSESGAQVGDPVFVIGNPGSTERLSTMAQLEFARDLREPFVVQLLQSRTDILSHFMDHHPETRPQYINQWFGWMNSLKLYRGRQEALNDPEIMGRKLGFEQQFQRAVQADPALDAKYGTVWAEIAGIRSEMALVYPTYMALNFSGSLRSQTLATAADMLRYATAVQRGEPDSVTGPLRMRIANREIDTRLDHHLIEAQIQDVLRFLGPDDHFALRALGGMTAEEAATSIIENSPSVVDAEARAVLLDDPSRCFDSDDPALALVRDALPRFEKAQQRYRELSIQESARTAQLARALFDVYGTDLPPDATFTLRIADGIVTPYDYNGTKAPAWTTFYGMYDRYYSHKGDEQWALPDRWLDPPADFDMSTPLNMVSTNDITGGNSGSPMINTDLEVVGLIFDSNIEGLSGDFIYTTEVARSVSVRAEAILEALRHMYRVERIVEELVGN